MSKLIEKYEHLTNQGYYNKATYVIADSMGLKMRVKHHKYGYHFEEDEQQRHIFKVTLLKDGKQYTFNFGQSIAEDVNEPTMYDVLSCLQKYEVDSFENFCGDFGYDNDSRTAERIYKAVYKEYENMERLFTEEEIELLQNIQ